MILFSWKNFEFSCLSSPRCVPGFNGESSKQFLEESNTVKVIEDS